MARMTWDQAGQRQYQTGISDVALFVKDINGDYLAGVPWNGVVSISEKPSGGEATPLYADNIKYLNLVSAEELKLTLEAYTYPQQFEHCIGISYTDENLRIYQQRRAEFALVYKTLLGNDLVGTDNGYRIHIVYGCTAAPAESTFASVNDSPEAMTFSWELTTTPIVDSSTEGDEEIKTALIVVDSTYIEAALLTKIEDTLYGSASSDPELVFPSTIAALADQ